MGLFSFNRARRARADEEKQKLEELLVEEEVEDEVPLDDDEEEDVEEDEDSDEELDLEDATLGQLRTLAKEAGIKGFRKKDREELIEELSEGE